MTKRSIGTTWEDFPNGFQLGRWLVNQRMKCTDPERRKKLEELPGWSWNATYADETFQRGYELSKKYGRVPQKFVTPCGHKLGVWQNNQAKNKVKGCTDPERRKLLEDIPGWVWNITEAKWNRGYELTKQYGVVRYDFVTPCGYKLGWWQNKERYRCKDKKRRKLLDSIPDWYWGPSNQ
jgi:hypothetical protein